MKRIVRRLLVPAALFLFWAAALAAGDGERVMRSGCGAFVMRYPAHLDAMAETVERYLCESVAEIAPSLGLGSIDTITVLIAGASEEYRRLQHGTLPRWSAAYSDTRAQVLGLDARVVVLMSRPMRTVMRHELSHLLFFQRVGNVYCPAWFVEGLAMRQSQEWGFADQWRLTGELLRRDVPYLEELEGPFPADDRDAAFAYAMSLVAVEELLGDSSGDLITLTERLRELGDFDEAFAATFGEYPDAFSVRLHALVVKRYKNVASVIQTVPYWLIAALLFLVAYAVKRRRSRRILEEWRRREDGAE